MRYPALFLALTLGACTSEEMPPEEEEPPVSDGKGDSVRCSRPEIHVSKSEAEVQLLCNGTVLHTFSAAFGADPVGTKMQRGDEKTPEGRYQVTGKVRSERFFRFLALNYPNAQDRQRSAEAGIDDPGDGIGIHGVKEDLNTWARLWIKVGNWTGLTQLWGPTDGCVGLANEDIEVLYGAAAVGTTVVIDP